MKTLPQLIAMITNNKRLDTDLAFAYVEEVFVPEGVGFDAVTIDRSRTTEARIVFQAECQHMSEYGLYTRWTVDYLGDVYCEHMVLLRGWNK